MQIWQCQVHFWIDWLIVSDLMNNLVCDMILAILLQCFTECTSFLRFLDAYMRSVTRCNWWNWGSKRCGSATSWTGDAPRSCAADCDGSSWREPCYLAALDLGNWGNLSKLSKWSCKHCHLGSYDRVRSISEFHHFGIGHKFSQPLVVQNWHRRMRWNFGDSFRYVRCA